jgi:hypothetical protein
MCETPERLRPMQLQPFLCCFFDIQVCRVKLILRVSSKILAVTQRLDGERATPWPFTKLRTGQSPPEGWVEARQARADAIRSSEMSEGMRCCLFMAERASICMRALYMPKAMKKAVDQVDFPETPAYIEELMRQQNELMAVSRKVQCARSVARVYRRVPSMGQLQEVRGLLHLMVDLPIKKVCPIIGLSHHTLMAVRMEAGFATWPYDEVCRGQWWHTVDEVRAQREAAIAALSPESYQAFLLIRARAAANFALFTEPSRRGAAAKPVPPPPSPRDTSLPSSPQSEEHQVASEEEEQAGGGEEEARKTVKEWDGRLLLSDDEENDQGFTEEDLNYWRELCDMPPLP